MTVINKVNDDSESILVASEDFFLSFSAMVVFCLINSHYKFFHLAQIEFIYVKKGKKKPNARHSVLIGVNRHSESNDGNK